MSRDALPTTCHNLFEDNGLIDPFLGMAGWRYVHFSVLAFSLAGALLGRDSDTGLLLFQ
jgi:hypothetical protein